MVAPPRGQYTGRQAQVQHKANSDSIPNDDAAPG